MNDLLSYGWWTGVAALMQIIAAAFAAVTVWQAKRTIEAAEAQR